MGCLLVFIILTPETEADGAGNTVLFLLAMELVIYSRYVCL
jgi:hypothetical protein